MGSLAFIIRDDMVTIPQPLCALPGQIYEAVEFLDHPPMHMCVGALAIVLIGVVRHGWTHALDVDGEIYLARLKMVRNGVTCEVLSLHPELPSGQVPYKSLNILGCVVEIYPTGDLDVCVMQKQEGLVYRPSIFERPYYMPKGPRRS